jgi:hypothetical protein
MRKKNRIWKQIPEAIEQLCNFMMVIDVWECALRRNMFLWQDQKFKIFITNFMLLSRNEPVTTCHKPQGLQGPNVILFYVHRFVCVCSKHETTWHTWHEPLLAVQSQNSTLAYVHHLVSVSHPFDISSYFRRSACSITRTAFQIYIILQSKKKTNKAPSTRKYTCCNLTAAHSYT